MKHFGKNNRGGEVVVNTGYSTISTSPRYIFYVLKPNCLDKYKMYPSYPIISNVSFTLVPCTRSFLNDTTPLDN